MVVSYGRCMMCCCWLDGLNGSYPHIKARTSLAVVAKAPQPKLQKFVKSKGWSIPSYSSEQNSFNRDFGVEFTKKVGFQARVCMCHALYTFFEVIMYYLRKWKKNRRCTTTVPHLGRMPPRCHNTQREYACIRHLCTHYADVYVDIFVTCLQFVVRLQE